MSNTGILLPRCWNRLNNHFPLATPAAKATWLAQALGALWAQLATRRLIAEKKNDDIVNTKLIWLPGRHRTTANTWGAHAFHSSQELAPGALCSSKSFILTPGPERDAAVLFLGKYSLYCCLLMKAVASSFQFQGSWNKCSLSSSPASIPLCVCVCVRAHVCVHIYVWEAGNTHVCEWACIQRPECLR